MLLFTFLVLSALCATPVCGLAGEQSTSDSQLTVSNPVTPSQGRVELATRELWRAGGSDGGPLFGVIVQALADEVGRIYLLDQQLSTVSVFTPDGQFRGTVAREGDGPGEVRRPGDMALLPDGKLGICKEHPGRLVCLTREGIPQPSINIGGVHAGDGQMISLVGAGYRAGTLVFLCQQIIPKPGRQETIFYLARSGLDGEEICRYFEKTLIEDFSDFRVSEVENFFPRGRLWAIGPDGRVYLVPDRNAYRVQVHRVDGELERIIERDFQPVPRDPQEKAATEKGYQEWYGNLPFSCTIELEDIEPTITRLMVDAANNLWVLTSRGVLSQPTGTMATYDVFDTQGRFIRQVGIACSGDGRFDDLFFVGEGRLLLVTGAYEAAMALRGTPLNLGDREPAPMEVVCLEIVSDGRGR